MLYKTISGISKKIAQMQQQDKAGKEKRHIWRESDFTEADKEEIKANAEKIERYLKNCDGKENKEVLTTLEIICPDVFLGFKAQDEYIATAKHNGIKIKI